jgi:hypothetical protein
MALATVLPAMSLIPSFVFISFVCSYFCLPILHQIVSPSHTLSQDPSEGALLRVLRPTQGDSRLPEAPKVQGTPVIGHQRP